jgi:hypothetical protein
MALPPIRLRLQGMGRARLGSILVVTPWLLALVGALLLGRELAQPKAGSVATPPAADSPKPEPPRHKEEIVFQPWEHVST